MVNKIKNLFWLLLLSTKQLLKVDLIRFIICYTRFVYYFKIRRRFKTFYPMHYISDSMPGNKKEEQSTVAYNASYTNLKTFFEKFNQFSGYRSQRLVAALATCFSGSDQLRNKKCLSIGPRTEGEIFSLSAHGAKFKDIYSIDLQTYSPKIIPADIIALPFENNFFDCVVAGWVLPYVTEKQKAADEIIRVCKNGALIAISHSWYPENDQLSNGDFTNGQVVVHTEEILKFFKENIQCIIFDYDQAKIDPSQRGDLISVFKVKKEY